jgi:hypothetical protein
MAFPLAAKVLAARKDAGGIGCANVTAATPNKDMKVNRLTK